MGEDVPGLRGGGERGVAWVLLVAEAGVGEVFGCVCGLLKGFGACCGCVDWSRVGPALSSIRQEDSVVLALNVDHC